MGSENVYKKAMSILQGPFILCILYSLVSQTLAFLSALLRDICGPLLLLLRSGGKEWSNTSVCARRRRDAGERKTERDREGQKGEAGISSD